MVKEFLNREAIRILSDVSKESGVNFYLKPESSIYFPRARIFLKADKKNGTLLVVFDRNLKCLNYRLVLEVLRFSRIILGKSQEMMVANAKHERAAIKIMEGDCSNFPKKFRKELRMDFRQLHVSLINHISRVIEYFWLIELLYKKYPRFRNEVRDGLRDFFLKEKYWMGMDEEFYLPKTIIKAINSANASFASYLDKLFGRVYFSLIYEGTEFEKIGKKLVKLNNRDTGYLGDNRTLDRWAKVLGVRGWYGWKKTKSKISIISRMGDKNWINS